MSPTTQLQFFTGTWSGSGRFHETLLRRDGNREATRIRLQQQPDSDAYARRIGEIRAPTLIQWGGRDDWVLPKYGQRFDAAIPDSRLRLYPGLGHMPMAEDPVRTAQDAASFLSAGS